MPDEGTWFMYTTKDGHYRSVNEALSDDSPEKDITFTPLNPPVHGADGQDIARVAPTATPKKPWYTVTSEDDTISIRNEVAWPNEKIWPGFAGKHLFQLKGPLPRRGTLTDMHFVKHHTLKLPFADQDLVHSDDGHEVTVSRLHPVQKSETVAQLRGVFFTVDQGNSQSRGPFQWKRLRNMDGAFNHVSLYMAYVAIRKLALDGTVPLIRHELDGSGIT